MATDGAKLDGIEANADVTDTANVTAAGALMDSELTNIAAVKGLNQGVATTDSPTFAGASFSGDLAVDTDTLFVDVSAGSVGIGTTSPQDPLHVAGDIRTDNNAYIVQESATGGAVRMLGINSSNVAYAGPIDNGPTSTIFNASATSAFSAFYTVGAERMRIDASGNVGIGTTSPTSVLHINKSVGVNVATDVLRFSSVSVSNPTDYYAGFQVQRGGSFGQGLNFLTTDELGNVSESMRITNAGKVGIGTSSPASALHVKSSENEISRFISDDDNMGLLIRQGVFDSDCIDVTGTRLAGGAQTGLALASGIHMPFYTAGIERMRIDASGNVGIGTTSPEATLDVSGPSVSFGAGSDINPNTNVVIKKKFDGVAKLIFARTTAGAPEDCFISCDGNENLTLAYNDASVTTAYLNITNNGSEVARFDSSGNLLVGTTDSSPYVATTGAIVSLNNGTRAAYIAAADSTASRTAILFANPNGEVGSIVTSASATAYNTSSDVRLKENITDAPEGNIEQLQVRSFDWKVNGEHQEYGFIAQELETVAPYAVAKGETEDDMWAVDYSKLVPMLVKEIQQLRARVATLEGTN